MYSILVCDDEKDIVSALKIYLMADGYQVFEAYNGKEALEVLKEQDIHLVLMDIMMPEMDGIAAMVKIRETSNVPVILLTAKSEDTDKILGLNVGADDYITKPFNPVELIARVKALLRRTEEERKISGKEKYIHMGDVFIDDVRRVVFVANEKCELTYKEYEILKHLIRNKGIVLTRDRLMEIVWGYNFEQGNRTVDVHIQSLRKKLGTAGEHIKTIRNVGYKVGE